MWTNWRTTLAGLGGLAAAVGVIITNVINAFDSDPLTLADWDAVGVAIGAVLLALGLVRARDDVVSTEQTRTAKR